MGVFENVLVGFIALIMMLSNSSKSRIFWIGITFVVSVAVLILINNTQNDPIWLYIMEILIGLMILALIEVVYQIWSRKKKNTSNMVYFFFL